MLDYSRSLGFIPNLSAVGRKLFDQDPQKKVYTEKDLFTQTHIWRYCTKLKLKLEDMRLMRFPCVIASFIHFDCDLFALCLGFGFWFLDWFLFGAATPSQYLSNRWSRLSLVL